MKHYAVVLGKTETGYSAYVPDLPGCVAAAPLLAETQQLIREALELHIEGLRRHGDPVPEPSTRIEHVKVSA